MATVKDTDLGDVPPGPRADLLVDRQRVTVHVDGLGLRARLGMERTTGGASHPAATLAVLSAGALPAATVSVAGAVVDAPGWLVVGLAAVVSLVHLAVGAVLVERQRRSGDHPDGDRPPGRGGDGDGHGRAAPRPSRSGSAGTRRGRKR